MNDQSRGHTCVVGLGWGDEGKGKIVDLLCAEYDVVVRFNGGANAGHTVCIGDETYALHLLPAGVLRPEKRSVIGPGVALDPMGIVEEIDGLGARGIAVGRNLSISDRAHMVMPYHILEDRLSESTSSQADQIGTTARGIGPCYADKMRRTSALRMCDLFAPNRLKQRLSDIVTAKRKMFQALYGEDGQLDAERIFEELGRCADRLKPYVCDTTRLLDDCIQANERILFEGANGTLLDVDHGTYPFVTSSGTTANAVASGAGVPARTVEHVIGVAKAYATRVGRGPFMTELSDETGDTIRRRGNEYGTTTGRPRRCGWFDAVAVRYGIRLSGVTEVAILHLDTLSGFEQVGICTGYECDGVPLDRPPADPEMLERITPVLDMLPGWDQPLRETDSFEDLPANAQQYIECLEDHIAAPITLIGVGPKRAQIIIRNTQALSVPPSVGTAT